MRTVAFDARALTSPAGGVRRYTSELYGGLVAAYPDIRWVAAGASEVPIPGLVGAAPAWTLPTNPGWMLTGLPRTVRRVRPDVFHAPAYAAPFWAGCPVVLTIHDVVYARHPEWYPARLDPLRRALFRWSATSAARVITDSAFSKSEIVAAYGIDAARIVVVPLGVSSLFTPPPSGQRRDPMVLHVGDLHRRRNLRMVLDVVIALRRLEPGLSTLTFTLVGVDRGEASALLQQASEAGDTGALVWQTGVSEAQLRTLYQRAAVLAYPSRYEGFGLPILEAMACGTPVVASHAASIPEVAGVAADLLDPDDDHAWFTALRAVLTDASRASAMAKAGVDHASRFTWARTAAATVEVFRSAASDHASR